MRMDIRELAVQYGKAWVEHDLNAGTASHTEDTIFQIHGDNGEATTGTQAHRHTGAQAHRHNCRARSVPTPCHCCLDKIPL